MASDKTPKTAPKPAAKKITPPKKDEGPMYSMPQEVKDWIERAQSTINHLKGQVERLQQENSELKSYKRWAEHRILRSDHDDR